MLSSCKPRLPRVVIKVPPTSPYRAEIEHALSETFSCSEPAVVPSRDREKSNGEGGGRRAECAPASSESRGLLLMNADLFDLYTVVLNAIHVAEEGSQKDNSSSFSSSKAHRGKDGLCASERYLVCATCAIVAPSASARMRALPPIVMPNSEDLVKIGAEADEEEGENANLKIKKGLMRAEGDPCENTESPRPHDKSLSSRIDVRRTLGGYYELLIKSASRSSAQTGSSEYDNSGEFHVCVIAMPKTSHSGKRPNHDDKHIRKPDTTAGAQEESKDLDDYTEESIRFAPLLMRARYASRLAASIVRRIKRKEISADEKIPVVSCISETREQIDIQGLQDVIRWWSMDEAGWYCDVFELAEAGLFEYDERRNFWVVLDSDQISIAGLDSYIADRYSMIRAIFVTVMGTRAS